MVARGLLLLLALELSCGELPHGRTELRNPQLSTAKADDEAPAICARATNCAMAPPEKPGCLAYACAPGSIGHRLPWCNVALTFAERAADLAARVPLSSAGQLLTTNGIAVPAVGLPEYLYGEEGLHGVRCPNPPPQFKPNGTTVFPEPIATAASFNDSLFHAIGIGISDEFRAFSNLRRGALSVFAPNINIFRDGRWGRGMETPGEDPTLTVRYAKGFVSGMQGEDDTHLKTITTCKHFAAYNVENYNQPNLGQTAMRQKFNALVSDQDMADT